MATMIPSFIDEHTAPGERQIFSYLQSAPDDWVVFHQLDLTAYNKGKPTEIDFVVIIPDLGILCIEIKSHESISFDDGVWSSASGKNTIKRSPFKQSNEATFTFINHLKLRGESFRRIPIYNAVMFPCSIFEIGDNLFFHKWNFYDKLRIDSLIRLGNFHSELKSGLRESIDNNATNVIPLSCAISSKTIESLKVLCAPIQKARLNRKVEIKMREEEAFDKLRIQQKSVITQIIDIHTNEVLNPRCLIRGAAGTGKTWVALEIAKIMADKGRRVGLISFNRNVGDWMVKKIAEEATRPNLVVGSIYKLLIDMLEIDVPTKISDDYWTSDFFDSVEESLTDPEISTSVPFDFLVIDEAQDILSNHQLWSLIPQILNGGLSDGIYCLLGDFDNQLFGSRTSLDESLGLLREKFKVTQMVLRENCRNYRQVGDMALCLSALNKTLYDGYRREGGSLDDVEIKFYGSSDEQHSLLFQIVEHFLKLGYKYDHIVILSFNTDELSTAAGFIASGSRLKLRPYRRTEISGIPYTTINSFKGLEAKIIIITDAVLDDTEFRRNQIYTAITRSTESVVMLCDNSSRKKFIQLSKSNEN